MIQLPTGSDGKVSPSTIGLIIVTVIFVIVSGYLIYSFIDSNARAGVASEYQRNFFGQSSSTTISTEVQESLFVEGEARISLKRDGVRDLTNNVELFYSSPMTGGSHLMKFFGNNTVGCEPNELIVSESEPATAICGDTEYTLEITDYTSRNQTVSIALTATTSDTVIPPSGVAEATGTSSSTTGTSTNELATSSATSSLVEADISTSSGSSSVSTDLNSTSTQPADSTTDATSSSSTAEICETKECLSTNLSSCQPISTSEPIEEPGTLALYDILGRSDVGACRVKVVYTQHPQSSWIDKPLICNFDTDLSIDAALRHAMESAVSSNLADCSGALYSDVLKDL